MSIFKCDGNTRVVSWEDLQPGNVLRLTSNENRDQGDINHEVSSSFSDSIIVEVGADDRGATTVRMSRPYMVATGDGTACRGWMVGVESLDAPATKLMAKDSGWRVVLLASGRPVNHLQQLLSDFR